VVDCNLVAFGHLHLVLCTSSHVGNARLPFSCVLQFTPDSASLILSFCSPHPLRSLSFHHHLRILFPCRRIRPHLLECLQTFHHKVCITFSLVVDRWRTETCRVFSSSSLNFIPLPSTTCTIVLSPLYDSLNFRSPHRPSIFSIFFSRQWHTGVVFVLLTSHGLSISCLGPALRDQALIPLLRSGLSSSPRESSPSPTFRERQRAARGQSTSSFQGSYNGQPSPTASTTSFHQRRSPPLAAQTVPGQIRRATSPLYHSTSPDGSPEPPQNQQSLLLHQISPQQAHSRSQSDLLQHSANQMTPAASFPRPVPRTAQPQFASREPFQMTAELIAEIDQAHSMHSLGAGMSGVAYAGGITSGPISRSTQLEPSSLPTESTLERARSGERPSPRELGGGPAVQRRDATSRDQDRETWELQRRGSMKRDPPQGIPAQQPSPKLEAQRTESPKYLPSLSALSDHSASYNPGDRELRSAQAAALPPSPPAVLRQNVPYMEPLRSTPPSVAKLATQSPIKARTPDKSLPVQEEPEEDGEQNDNQEQERDRWTPGGGRPAHRHEPEVRDPGRQLHTTSSPTPSSDLLPEGYDPRYDARHERNGRENHAPVQRKNSDQAKQNHDGDDEERAQNSGRTQSQDEESYTPRSPSASLPPERSFGTRDSPVHPQQQQQQQQQQQAQRHQSHVPRIRSRNGAMDGLGLRTFDATSFENTLEQLVSHLPEENHRSYSVAQINSPRHITSPHQVHSPSHEEPDHFLDDPAAAYYHGYPHSPMATHSRPGAPIPPTPHSHTAAPSPSPLISGMGRANGLKPVLPPYSPIPPVGSPYPYPYGHIRRGHSYAGSYNGTVDLSQMDPNVVREQLALQMQIYALNNGGMVSDSTLSPSSTPFPGPQYNPWTYLQTSNAFGGRRGGMVDSNASMQSSPSHQPVALPPLSRGHRGLRHRERSQDMRRRAKVRPPPRVESTQPRDTSPELSSGEETAGESKVGEHQSEPQRYAPRPARWDESADDEDEADIDDGEWIDEDVGMEGVADDLLQLEFHTDYVGNPEKRRRRWKLRWGSPASCCKSPPSPVAVIV
jgi:hypothetical protein